MARQLLTESDEALRQLRAARDGRYIIAASSGRYRIAGGSLPDRRTREALLFRAHPQRPQQHPFITRVWTGRGATVTLTDEGRSLLDRLERSA